MAIIQCITFGLTHVTIIFVGQSSFALRDGTQSGYACCEIWIAAKFRVTAL